MGINSPFFYLLLFSAGYLLLIFLCEYLNRKWHISPEYTRKAAHMISTLSALFFPYIFNDYRHVLGLSVFYFIVLFISRRVHVFNSIEGVERRTGGSYLLALAIGIIYYLSIKNKDTAIYNLPILILAISDTLANIVGKNIASRKLINNKTFAGSSAFFLSALLISITYFLIAGYKHPFESAFLIVTTLTLVELFSPYGIDNFTVPLIACVLMLWLK
ncbi:MAG: hypothetical protein LBT29_01925 [Flavobacteriaceae bacterium]|jgi:dolichol kinase|nr:hypothetical protein [Flavobacteriaceae bacterium]